MAGKTGVSDAEYNTLYRNLEGAQKGFMSAIDQIKSKISEVNCKGGGLYTDNVTPNVQKLLQTLGRIQDSIGQMQTAEKEVISNFQESVSNIDTCS